MSVLDPVLAATRSRMQGPGRKDVGKNLKSEVGPG